MAKVTGFNCFEPDGTHIPCDAYGNNVAFKCPKCGYPVIAVMLTNFRGSSLARPAKCPNALDCDFKGWVEVVSAENALILRSTN